jgi:SAM-dependent methyltransferase
VIDDGEKLAAFADDSLDFVIANHFIEHCENPIAAIANHLRVLRNGGVLYMAVPDKRSTFDVDRPVTTVEHLARDFRDGPEWSRFDHFEEYARIVNRIQPYDGHARYLMDKGYSIHYHVWTPESFRELLDYCRDTLKMPFELLELRPNGIEFIAVLRRTPAR